MQQARRHYDALPRFYAVFLPVDRKITLALKHVNERVAVGFVRADLLAAVEGEKRHIQRRILRESARNHLVRGHFD